MKLRSVGLVVVFAGASWAQSYLGGIRGSVLDGTGKTIGETKVSIIDEAGGTQRSTLASGEGAYSFSQVVPATYTVIAEAPGFKRFERKHVIVGTQEFVSLDLKMDLGSVSESVQVTEEVSLIEAANASQGQVIDRQQLIDLPNLGRNPFMMSKLAQNVTPAGDPHYNRMQDQSGSSQITIAGGPVRGNNYLLDGIPITDANNRAMIIPTLEAVQEVKIQSNTYDAEMARTGGGMFNTYLKSGGNQYHGSLFGAMRQTSWAANNFFNNAAGIPLPEQPNRTFGASFGGAVRVPKIYNGKNRTFFWLAWEGYDDTQSNSSQFYTPTALERAGNFSQSKAKGGALNVIYDPQTTVCGGSPNTCTRTPFSGNIIPADRLNKTGLAIAATYVQPQTVSSFFGDPNLTQAALLPSRASQKTAKLDHEVTRFWRASLSYARYFSLEPGNTWFATVSSPDQWRLQRRVDATQFNNILTLSPTTVLTVRYGFNRFPNYGYQVSQGYNLANLGFDPSFIASVAAPTFPNITMSSVHSLGTNNNFAYVHHSKNFSTGISKYRGRHALKAGFDYRRIHDDGNDFANSAGAFTFNGVFTRSTPLTAVAGTGADLADMLVGAPSAGTGYLPTKLYEYANYYGAYVQDDIRLTKSLTVNLGLRWEREYGLQEANNQMVVGFNTSAANPLAANVTGISPKGVIQFAGLNGNPVNVSNPNLNKFAPRIGVAWQLNGKTTIRGGYGLYWAPQFAIGTPYNPPGFTATSSYVASNDGNATAANNLTNPFPTGVAKPTGSSLGDLTGIGQSLSIIDPNSKSPRVHQYSFDVQRQLPFGVAIEVGYVGSHSSHLTQATANININALNPSLLPSVSTSSVANPFFGKGGAGVIGGSTVSAVQLALPYPTFSTINYQFSDVSHARYDSLVAKAQKRMSLGLTFLSTLTWSRNHDASSGGAGNFLNGGAVGPQNPYNIEAEYSLANVDTPLRWSSGFTYELPFGRDKKMLTNKSLDYLVGGWSVNAVSVYQSGFPLQIAQSTNNNSTFGYASQRPSATGITPVTSGSLEDRLGRYIDAAAFSTSPQRAFGNLSRALEMRGPGQANWDLSVFKSLHIGEKFKGQFRAEALNAFNTPMFAAPNVSYGSGSFGKITSQVNFARMMQLGIRLFF